MLLTRGAPLLGAAEGRKVAKDGIAASVSGKEYRRVFMTSLSLALTLSLSHNVACGEKRKGNPLLYLYDHPSQ